ncbi:hypothetical protein SK128_025335 [Halocaridina rubra]|uniref:C2H2-type domain-containing protein n=1 Tax=Halocaridina rubra TaxID=373956 RepID=A0AAN8XF96_HALRR
MAYSGTDVVREAATYLEYFLKGLSDCNVVGSYTVQFLELRGFTSRLEASLTSHIVCLVANMKGLLMRFDHSVRPICNVEVQTEIAGSFTPYNSQSSSNNLFKTSASHSTKRCMDVVSEGNLGSNQSSSISIFKTSTLHSAKSFFEEPCSEIAQMCNSNPLLEHNQDSLKYSRLEIPVQCSKRESNASVSDRNILPDKEERTGAMGSVPVTNEGNIVTLPFHDTFDSEVKGEFENSTLGNDGQGEILLDHMDDSDTASSEGLMYSVYTMTSCGSLQLVSRVLSKTNAVKDNLRRPVQKAMIEINSVKEDMGTVKPFDQYDVEIDADEYKKTNVLQENETLLLKTNEVEGNEKRLNKVSKYVTSLDVKLDSPPSLDSVVTDIVKLGPEDLDGTTWCGICKAELPSMGSLKTHISRMHSKIKCCKTCKKTAKAEDMSAHVRECHSDLPYVCHVCGQSLRSNGSYQRHMDIHKEIRGNACEICGRTFSRMEYYRDHKRIHTGEKPYECHLCKKTFSRLSNLHTHMKIHNSEEKWYSCNVCLKSFARSDKLKDHMIRHMQIKRFSCRLCTKSYNEKRDLVKHIDKTHSLDKH